MTRRHPDPPSRADAALDRVVALQAEIDALHARRAEAIHEFEQAFAEQYPPAAGRFQGRAARAELACALRLPERTVERLMGEASGLIRLFPATLAGLSDGLYSYRHAQIVLNETAGLSDGDRAAVERIALGSAKVQTAARFTHTVRALRERRDPSTMITRASTAFADRGVTLEIAPDGMAWLSAYLGAVEATASYDRLTGAALKLASDGDPRTVGALRADLLVDLLLDRDTTTAGMGGSMLDAMDTELSELLTAQETDLGAFHGIVPTVIVTVPALTLLGGDEPGTVDGAGPIDAATARRLTAHAKGLYRLLTHPETGVAMSLSRTQYQIPDGLRRWLRIRDGSCRFPMCNISTRRSDIDHTQDWARSGTTDHDNLAHLSRGHHTLKHHGGWRVRQDRAGHLTWTSYLGRRYTTMPETG